MALLLLAFFFFIPISAAAGPYCNESCGAASIPYPFGISPSCGLPDYYRITCKENSSLGSGFLPFLSTSTGDFQVLNFSTDFLILNSTFTTNWGGSGCNQNDPNGETVGSSSFVLPSQGPFALADSNFFVVNGCNTSGQFSTDGSDVNGGDRGNCTNACYNYFYYPFCIYYACCAVGLPSGSRSVNITTSGGECGASFVLSPDTYSPTYFIPLLDRQPGSGIFGLKISWGLMLNETQNCSTVVHTPAYACVTNSRCIDVVSNEIRRYVCNCSDGYRGDGYKNGTGCTDIDECAEHLDNCVSPPDGNCQNTPGSFVCNCSTDTGNGIRLADGGTGCVSSSHYNVAVPAIIGVVSGGAAILIIGSLLGWAWKLRGARLRKHRYFLLNGGLQLKECISCSVGRETARLFSINELEKATKNFAEHLKLGSGGYGTVYKGNLEDKTVVAIKKSNDMGQQDVKQFINEVIILSQINHRNVVRLLGCCLETRVPLLVYEYVSNGTLDKLLHPKDGRFCSWESRLQIALETAEALAYLHSSASTPIIHRDVKSSNILLDRTWTPKVADFGLSRLVPMDKTHVSTVVQGTLGYLDPEYFQTFQLTDKSDVYSFGVILLELATSLRPICHGWSPEENNLAMLCITRLRTGDFPSLIDPRLSASGDPILMSSIIQVANLAARCLSVEGQSRPSMKEVSQELLWIRGSRQAIDVNLGRRPVENVEEDDSKSLVQFTHMQMAISGASSSTSDSWLGGSLELATLDSLRVSGR